MVSIKSQRNLPSFRISTVLVEFIMTKLPSVLFNLFLYTQPGVTSIVSRSAFKAIPSDTKTWVCCPTVRRGAGRTWPRSWAAAWACRWCRGAADSCASSSCSWCGSGGGRTRTRIACPTARACPGSGVWASSSSWRCVDSTDSLEARLSLRSGAVASPSLEQTALR